MEKSVDLREMDSAMRENRIGDENARLAEAKEQAKAAIIAQARKTEQTLDAFLNAVKTNNLEM